jgi:hypothetical protein
LGFLHLRTVHARLLQKLSWDSKRIPDSLVSGVVPLFGEPLTPSM